MDGLLSGHDWHAARGVVRAGGRPGSTVRRIKASPGDDECSPIMPCSTRHRRAGRVQARLGRCGRWCSPSATYGVVCAGVVRAASRRRACANSPGSDLTMRSFGCVRCIWDKRRRRFSDGDMSVREALRRWKTVQVEVAIAWCAGSRSASRCVSCGRQRGAFVLAHGRAAQGVCWKSTTTTALSLPRDCRGGRGALRRPASGGRGVASASERLFATACAKAKATCSQHARF